MPLPTFLIAGAQKCGTSTLVATLRRHPQVQMARPKELHFFDRKLDKGLEWYAEQFTPDPRQTQWGEASPSYVYDVEARTAMCELLPEAKVVVILRDPAKRAYSHFWHSKRLGFEKLETFQDALAAEPERMAHGARSDRIRFSYLDRGHYVEQLESLEALKGRDNLHVMLLDDLASDRIPTLEGLFGFIGVKKKFASTIKEQWTNKYRVAEKPGEKAKAVPYPPLPPETRAMMVEHFGPWNDRLGDWLGRDLSAWSKV
jgi:hypothetical protein